MIKDVCKYKNERWKGKENMYGYEVYIGMHIGIEIDR
jgi:hypothetical protein